MEIFDMHVHIQSCASTPDPTGLAGRLDAAGVAGCALMSADPADGMSGSFLPYSQRIESLFAWVQGLEDRVLPVFWVHPYENGAVRKVEDAAVRGVAGYKMICDRYYVDEPCSMQVLSAIAETGKPVIFHSGILWGGRVSSKYNRPVNWEALLTIPGLRFSMGHCSWPWHDECIAMYGKFLNAYAENPNASAEMFFDLTPGTPEIYRRELLFKLLHAGYDVPHNIMFGTDSIAEQYKRGWVRKWVETDSALYDDFGAPERLKELIFRENAMRFFGRIPKNFTHISPVCDDADTWNLHSEY